MADDSRTGSGEGTQTVVVRKRHTGWLIVGLIAVVVIAGIYFWQGTAGEDAVASGARDGDGVASAVGDAEQ